ncbi:alcohol dehydrogenase catalytic domain-containing protein [Streptomyces sp. NPDC057565]|uniref:alcohol dehydrogenase catalytic domain-containing protein n=1 Tax=Streptomyces sp. NPDC057565 TaxID=3346169 RepID=UPI0036BE21C3
MRTLSHASTTGPPSWTRARRHRRCRSDKCSAGFPVTPGHEVAGVIAEVGDQVTGWEVGERLPASPAATAAFACGPPKPGLGGNELATAFQRLSALPRPASDGHISCPTANRKLLETPALCRHPGMPTRRKRHSALQVDDDQRPVTTTETARLTIRVAARCCS